MLKIEKILDNINPLKEQQVRKIRKKFFSINYSTKPICILEIPEQIDEEDFYNTLNHIKGFYQKNIISYLKIRIIFTDFQKLLCFYHLIDQINKFSILNFKFLFERETKNLSVQQNLKQNFKENKNPLTIKKKTGRFYINAKNIQQFEIAKKIIGRNGSNMKQIIQKCQKRFNNNAKDLIKLRLRGKGSYYKEGSKKKECKDQLHICVSGKTKEIFQFAFCQVEDLLKRIFIEYNQYCSKNGYSTSNKLYHKVLKIN